MKYPSLEFVMKVMHLMEEYDLREDLYWSFNDDKFEFFVLCNDTFCWGCADGEPVTEENFELLKSTIEECSKLKENNHSYPILRAVELFAARSRKMRPQGACYQYYPEVMWPLFNACGPERETDFGNPLSIEQAKKRRDDKLAAAKVTK